MARQTDAAAPGLNPIETSTQTKPWHVVEEGPESTFVLNTSEMHLELMPVQALREGCELMLSASGFEAVNHQKNAARGFRGLPSCACRGGGARRSLAQDCRQLEGISRSARALEAFEEVAMP